MALGDLVDAKLLIPRSDCVVVSYKGTTYTASLDDDGAIAYEGVCVCGGGLHLGSSRGI